MAQNVKSQGPKDYPQPVKPLPRDPKDNNAVSKLMGWLNNKELQAPT